MREWTCAQQHSWHPCLRIWTPRSGEAWGWFASCKAEAASPIQWRARTSGFWKDCRWNGAGLEREVHTAAGGLRPRRVCPHLFLARGLCTKYLQIVLVEHRSSLWFILSFHFLLSSAEEPSSIGMCQLEQPQVNPGGLWEYPSFL